MKILSIETSCDETGMALVEASGPSTDSTSSLQASSGQADFPKFKVLKNLVSSQIKIHRPFGGVVPSLAKREHIKNLPLLWQRIMNNELRIKGKKSIIHNSQFTIQDIDLIAVTVGPGLEPALWTGIVFAQELADKLKKPLIGANHLEGHLYSFLLTQKTAISKSKSLNPKQKNLEIRNLRLEFPAICLLVSGGHTTLLLMKNLKTWKRLGETKDDAAGEAFDKVARMLNLPYPGGPEIEKISKKGNPKAISFPRPMLNQKNYDFSFSGLKTSVFYFLREQKIEGIMNNELRIKGKKSIIHNSQFTIQDVAASFQQAVIDVLVAKTMHAAGEYGACSVILCGGVAANKSLRKMLKVKCDMSHLTFHVPHMKYNNDNAAMIAAAAYMGLSRKKKYKLEANGNLNI